MALIMSKKAPNGATGNYWRAIATANARVVQMQLYTSKDDAKAGATPLYTTTYEIAAPGMTKEAIMTACAATPPMNPYALCYKLVSASKKDGKGVEQNPYITATDDK